jgi:exonuclease SbcC
MKRAVLRIGGYQREYFISHTEALQEQADAVIDLEVLAAA